MASSAAKVTQSVSTRVVTSHIPQTPLHGSLKRLIGGLDIRGQGTNHPLFAVEPFILCDAAPELPGSGKPPFGFHPHHGLIAMTYILEGAFDDEDNLGAAGVPPARHINETGSIYMVSSGKGLCHSEKSASEGNNGAMQTIVRIPQSNLDQFPVPEISRAQDNDLPKLPLEGGGCLKLLVGSTGGLTSPVSVAAMPRFILCHIEVVQGTSVSIPLDADLDHGFAHVLKGGIVGDEGSIIGGVRLQTDSGVYLFGDGEALHVSNPPAAETLHLFLGAGVQNSEPWVKLLGHNGFIVANSEETATAVMTRIDEKRNAFTYKDIIEA